MRRIRRIVVHHAAAYASLVDVDAWHADRGWGSSLPGGGHMSVGYHYLVEADGTLRLGRPEATQGAHCRGHNEDSIGVCLAVDARQPVPSTCWTQAVALVVDVMRRHGLAVGAVSGHGELGATECPGFDPQVFREAVKARQVEVVRRVVET